MADRSILSTICRQRETLLGEKIGRREGKESFLIERDFFFFLAKLLFEKFSQVPERRHVAIRIAICSNVT